MNKPPETIHEASLQLFAPYADIIRGEIEKNPDPLADDPRLSLENLLWMCETAASKADQMREDKISRWLGFVQGCLAMRRLIDCDAEREISRPLFYSAYRHNGEDTPITLERT